MLGTFENNQPCIKIGIKGFAASKEGIDALIDSGFSGHLQIPFAEALPLGLMLTSVESKILADGSTSSHLVCSGQVCIGDQYIETTIDIQPVNIVLIGTKLLKELKKIFILDCATGRVEIN